MEPSSFADTLARVERNLSAGTYVTSLVARCKRLCQDAINEEEFWYYADHIIDDLAITLNTKINSTCTAVLSGSMLNPRICFTIPNSMLYFSSPAQRSLFLKLLLNNGIASTPTGAIDGI